MPVTEADRTVFAEEELLNGWRLACQAQATVPRVLECGQWHMDVLTDDSAMRGAGKRDLGIAIDLGTTTIAAQMIDLESGDVLAVETRLNSQSQFGSDVMSRIHAVLSGADLTTPVHEDLRQVVERLAGKRIGKIVEIVIVGNTVMHHLFSGFDVEPLSHVPFVSPRPGEQQFSPAELRWPVPSACSIRFLRSIGGFVGSDILAGIVATKMAERDDLIALIDLGTNGEIAIGNRHQVVCASTAAGPAFEAGAIRMGMRAVDGAIAHVSITVGAQHVSVIGHKEPRGICGSGIVDAIAAGLTTSAILSSGRIANGSKIFPVAGPVILYQSDIRELQLAKAAIAAGFRLLLKHISASQQDVTRVYLAGAFGNYVQAESAIRIGLIQAPRNRIEQAGNTALRGAKRLLLASEPPVLPRIEHVSLASDPQFPDEFAACMAFPAADDVAIPKL
jgi:uncharacterized 2Fe-2S/4Fe-4S cluster protein (DUF4445 family)